MAKKKKLNLKKFIRFLVVAALLLVVAAAVFTPVLIEMNGDKKVEIGYGETYEDAGAKVKFGLGKIKTESDVDTSKIGKYKVKYSFLMASRTRTVNVVDKIAPVLLLDGPEIVYMATGSEYQEQGFTAYDEIDGDLTSKVSAKKSSISLSMSGSPVYQVYGK